MPTNAHVLPYHLFRDRLAWKRRVEIRYGSALSCMGCGRTFKPHQLDIHEIERRGQAPHTCYHPCNYLLLCRQCHAGLFDCAPHAFQLACKTFYDQPHFDLDQWLRIRDPELKAPRRVTIEEITAHMDDVQHKWEQYHGKTTHHA